MPPRKGKKKAAPAVADDSDGSAVEGSVAERTRRRAKQSDSEHEGERKGKAEKGERKPAPLNLEGAKLHKAELAKDPKEKDHVPQHQHLQSEETSAASSAVGTPLSERGAPFTGSTAASHPGAGRGLRQRFADMTRELGKGAEELSVRIRRKVSTANGGGEGWG